MSRTTEEGTVKTMRGGDLLDKWGVDHTKIKPARAASSPREADFEDLGDGLGGAVEAVSTRAKMLFESGLTREALVLLITHKCPYARGAKHPISEQQVEAVLTGISKLGEWLQP